MDPRQHGHVLQYHQPKATKTSIENLDDMWSSLLTPAPMRHELPAGAPWICTRGSGTSGSVSVIMVMMPRTEQWRLFGSHVGWWAWRLRQLSASIRSKAHSSSSTRGTHCKCSPGRSTPSNFQVRHSSMASWTGPWQKSRSSYTSWKWKKVGNWEARFSINNNSH